MAAPADVTVRDLNGKWIMDKTLSSDVDPILKVQNFSWVTRKAITMATVTLAITSYTDDDSAVHIDIAQTATGGIKGTTEKRTLSWVQAAHSDPLFGDVVGRSRIVSKSELEALVPECQGHKGITDEEIGFLKGVGKWEEGEEEWVQSYVDGKGWVAEQIWGFEIIDGKRYYVRHVVTANDAGQCVTGRLVYSFLEGSRTASS